MIVLQLGTIAPGAAVLLPGMGLLLQQASPDADVLLATAGLCLIALELNRPGLIAPGALGLLAVLFGAAGLHGHAVQPLACLLLLASVGALAMNLWYKLPVWSLVLATLTLSAGLRNLLPPTGVDAIHLPVAVGCGLGLGGLGAVLSRVALRARRAKRVN